MDLTLLANIDVDDLEKAIAFYGNALGLRLGRRLAGSVAEMLGATSAIYLLAKPAGSTVSVRIPQRRDYQRHWTPVHLDFVVADVDAAVQKAQAAGAQREGDLQTHAWGRIAHMADPFGNGLCLIEFIGRGYDEIVTSQEEQTMPTKRVNKKSTAKKATTSRVATKKSTSNKSSKTRRSPGIISKAKKVVRAVVAGAASGAATGAVKGAAEAASKATGIGQSSKKGSASQKDKAKS
jgi:predicted enzyme related to lactoylglutathione lyase